MADIAEKRAILEIVYSDFTFKDATLAMTMRKPFDTLAKGLKMEYGRDSASWLENYWAAVFDALRDMPQINTFITKFLRSE